MYDTLLSKLREAPPMESSADRVSGVWAVDRADRLLRLGRAALSWARASLATAWLPPVMPGRVCPGLASATAGRVTAGLPGTEMAGDWKREIPCQARFHGIITRHLFNIWRLHVVIDATSSTSLQVVK